MPYVYLTNIYGSTFLLPIKYSVVPIFFFHELLLLLEAGGRRHNKRVPLQFQYQHSTVMLNKVKREMPLLFHAKLEWNNLQEDSVLPAMFEPFQQSTPIHL